MFVYSGSKLIAEYSTATPPSNPTTSWTVTDQLGSPRVIVNALGTVVSRRDFMPFGEDLGADGTYRKSADKYGQSDSVRQKFTGYQKDGETGLDFAEARMYENRHGRFTAIDPLLASGKSAAPQTFNRYVYVMNRPLVLQDPDGLQAGIANGNVYRKGREFAIFKGKPFDDYKPVRRTINTTTTINGVEHNVTVKPNGWRIGDRVDGAKFEVQPAQPSTAGTNSGNKVGDLVDAVNNAPMFEVAKAIHKVATPDAVSVSYQVPLMPQGGTVTLTSDLDIIVSPDAGREYGRAFLKGGFSAGFTWITDTDAASSRNERTSFFTGNSVSGGACYNLCVGGTVVPGESGNRFGLSVGGSPGLSGSLKFGHGIYVTNLLGEEPPTAEPKKPE